MLVQTDETKARLKPAEVRERTRQAQAEAIAGKIRADEASVPTNDGGMDVTNDLDRVGAPMFTKDFVARLKRINPNFHYETSKQDSAIGGIYFVHPRPIRDDGERRQFICRCEPVVMPEFHVFKPRFEQHPDPTIHGHMQNVRTVDEMVWGWRTVLARIIRAGFLTHTQADKAFGLPTKDSQRWQTMTGLTIQ